MSDEYKKDRLGFTRLELEKRCTPLATALAAKDRADAVNVRLSVTELRQALQSRPNAEFAREIQGINTAVVISYGKLRALFGQAAAVAPVPAEAATDTDDGDIDEAGE